MHAFEDLSVVHSTLKHLMEREPALVKLLPRQTGNKEARYAHLLSGDVEVRETPLVKDAPVGKSAAENDRITQLESEVEALQTEIRDLKRQFAEFRKQFE
jgi:uncharacterized protein YceH (UPF0502 family)